MISRNVSIDLVDDGRVVILSVFLIVCVSICLIMLDSSLVQLARVDYERLTD